MVPHKPTPNRYLVFFVVVFKGTLVTFKMKHEWVKSNVRYSLELRGSCGRYGKAVTDKEETLSGI